MFTVQLQVELKKGMGEPTQKKLTTKTMFWMEESI
jgi:hypothetical protein